jgi:hypothetical protein
MIGVSHKKSENRSTLIETLIRILIKHDYVRIMTFEKKLGVTNLGSLGKCLFGVSHGELQKHI